MTDIRISRRAALVGGTIFGAWTIAGRQVRAQQVNTEDFKDMKPIRRKGKPESACRREDVV